MNSQCIIRRLGITFSAMGLALLTACGGGGADESPVASAPVAAPAPVVAPATTTPLCGVTPVEQQGPESFSVLANQSMEINGFDARITLLSSPTGYSYAGVDVSLSVPMKDLRGVMQHGYPEADTQDSMGVEMGSRFAPGSVGCVTGVTRVFNVNGATLMSWASAEVPNLPVDQLTSQAVNGFEYVHNFETTEATAVFRMSKVALADPASASICHIAAGGAVDCSTPDVRESADGQRWELRLPITSPGVYMLSANHEQLV